MAIDLMSEAVASVRVSAPEARVAEDANGRLPAVASPYVAGGEMVSEQRNFPFSDVLTEMVNERKAVGQSGKVFDGLSALSTINNIVVLRNLMMELKPERTLEIGLSFGGSCLTFCASHRDLHRQPVEQHVAIDPFQQDVWDNAGLVAADRQGLSGYVTLLPQLSSIALPQLWSERASFGLIYIDGSHLFEDVLVDAYFSTRLTAEGGMVLFDDCMNPHVAKVVSFMRSNMRGHFQEINLTPYRDEEGRNLRYLVARAMNKQQLVGFERTGVPARSWDASFQSF